MRSAVTEALEQIDWDFSWKPLPVVDVSVPCADYIPSLNSLYVLKHDSYTRYLQSDHL